MGSFSKRIRLLIHEMYGEQRREYRYVDITLKGTECKINADLYKGCKVSLMFNNVTQCH